MPEPHHINHPLIMHNLTSRQTLLIHLALSFTAANVDELIDAHWDEHTQQYDSSFQPLNLTDDNRDQLGEELRSILASTQATHDRNSKIIEDSQLKSLIQIYLERGDQAEFKAQLEHYAISLGIL